MDLTWVFKCNKCTKPMLFLERTDFNVGEEHVVVTCVKCENTGVKARIEAITDKAVIRCSICGGWKMESSSCITCKKINALSV
jgi:hypothetical protein